MKEIIMYLKEHKKVTMFIAVVITLGVLTFARDCFKQYGYVESVKNGNFPGHEEYTVEELMSNAFKDLKWSYKRLSQTTECIVAETVIKEYLKDIKVEYRFILSGNGNFKLDDTIIVTYDQKDNWDVYHKNSSQSTVLYFKTDAFVEELIYDYESGESSTIENISDSI